MKKRSFLWTTAEQIFHFVLIKPTHYDDAGYPIQWVRSIIPSNTLACLAGFAREAQGRKLLGPDVQIRLHIYDETNRRVRPHAIIRRIHKTGGRALITLVGVQSNQFPRAIDLARPCVAAGLPVCVGGFHVSGCLAMLPEMPEGMRAAQALGISFFAGEDEEGRLDRVLLDAWNGRLAPLYDHLGQLPNLSGQPLPHGIGWFVQTYQGEPVVWQFGLADNASSSMVITLPVRGLTLIMLANSAGLAQGFNLAAGDLTASPFARLFLELFVR